MIPTTYFDSTHQPMFVAEVSSNHHRDLGRCLAFIDVASEIGCDAVKFQLFRIRELFAPEVLARRPDLRARQAWELPAEFLPELAHRCKEKGLAFSCTPFYLEAVAELEPYVAFYKIASYELMWHPLLRACASTGKPVVLSTGMATLEEVARSVSVLREAGCQNLTLLHCVSGYPTPVQDCNLSVMQTLRETQRCPVGWSDHSVNAAVVARAVHRWAATMVEFHLDLDGTGDEYRTGHCWLPGPIAEVIRLVREGSRADGTRDKRPAPVELPDRDWRADPDDGLRPLRATRRDFIKE